MIDNRRFVFFPQWVEVLINSDDNCILAVCKKVNGTYFYIIHVINALEKKKLVSTKIIGRKRIINLTAAGRNVVRCLKELKLIIS